MKRYNRQKSWFFLVSVFFTAAVMSISCTDFFSTSLAPWAARDPANMIPAVSLDNVGDLITMTENNPDLSLEVLKKIKNAADSVSGDEKAELQAAALATASNAAGLGQAILGAAGELSNLQEGDLDGAKKMVVDAVNGMQNLNDSSALLAGIMPDPSDPDFDTMTSKANADDLAMAALVLIASEAKNQEEEMDDYFTGLATKPELTYNENLSKAMALAATLEGRADELSPSLKDVLDGINLNRPQFQLIKEQ